MLPLWPFKAAEDEVPNSKAHVRSFPSNAGRRTFILLYFLLSADHGNIYHMFRRSLVDQPKPRTSGKILTLSRLGTSMIGHPRSGRVKLADIEYVTEMQ
jgi:hypothetical protein